MILIDSFIKDDFDFCNGDALSHHLLDLCLALLQRKDNY